MYKYITVPSPFDILNIHVGGSIKELKGLWNSISNQDFGDTIPDMHQTCITFMGRDWI